MLIRWRRHLKNCAHRPKGRSDTKCSCPVWCDGDHDDVRIRESLKTRDWGRAGRKLAELEEQLARGDRARRRVREAVATFLSQRDVAPATIIKYRRILGRLASFAKERRIETVVFLAGQQRFESRAEDRE